MSGIAGGGEFADPASELKALRITLASVSGIRAWLHFERGEAAAGLAVAQTTNEQALVTGLPDLVALSWLVLALAQVTAGDVASGARSIATGIELGEKSGHAIAAPLFHMVATDHHHRRGNLGEVFHSRPLRTLS